MDSKNPEELIEGVEEEQKIRGELATDALQWFLDGNVEEFFPRGAVVEELSEELGVSASRANTAISDTVGDIVDPVQQITRRNNKYVGVIDYKVFSDEGAYGYIDFDDRKGERKRVVCARCVEKHKYDENITHATQGEGSSKSDATWQQLLNKVTAHYADNHTKPPSEIEPGASLVSGTTIGGNTAFHTGNLADRGAVTITPSTTNQTIIEGFHNGNGFVEGDVDLTSDNIRDGVTIFGVTGTFGGTQIIDNFEDEDISEYGGNTGDFSITTTSYDGTYALTNQVLSNIGRTISSTTGLDSYPSAGDTFAFNVRRDDSGESFMRTRFGTEDESSSPGGYRIFHDKPSDLNGEFGIGGPSGTDLFEFTYQPNTWYEIEVNWGSSGSITASLYNADPSAGRGSLIGSTSINDTTYTSGGIGMDQNKAGGYWDFFRIL